MSASGPTLRYQPLPVGALKDEHIAIWRRVVADCPIFSSPFFSPGYSRLVGDCVEGVMAGLIWQEGELVGFFPYELTAPGEARPVGSVFNDYQGVIVRPGVLWGAEELLRGLDLKRWHFDHILATQSPWKKYWRVCDVSWVIDLSEGFGAYESLMRANGRRMLRDLARKRRNIEREIGPVLFSPHERNHSLLDEMLARKSAQWARSGWPGRFTSSWELRLMHGLLDVDTPDFGGLFTVLRCAGRPVAMHLGLRSARTWHYWTTCYDDEFRAYSPGLIMMAEMARYAPQLGLRELDMGKEDFEYKRRFHTHVVPLAEGVATFP